MTTDTNHEPEPSKRIYIPRKLQRIYDNCTPEEKEILEDVIKPFIAQQTGQAITTEELEKSDLPENKDLIDYIHQIFGIKPNTDFNFLAPRRQILMKLAFHIYEKKHMDPDELYSYLAHIGVCLRTRTFKEDYLGSLFKYGVIYDSNSIEWNEEQFQRFLKERKQK
jgi:hypothetical protein